ncbi:MAG: NUDIX domain-containing protein [Patescibacteria group bacterium]|nr:NUDIX domain-containing protein [Patescibacteria group bacterium]
MNLPSKEECLRLYEQYHTPENVQDHCRQVNNVAVLLANKLKAAGIDIDVDLVDRASLLHDLIRIPEQVEDRALKNKHHAEVNYEILREKYPEMAEVILAHRMDYLLSPEKLDTWEKKVVNYADKRINNDEVVTIEDRLYLGNKRWKIKEVDDKSDEILASLRNLEKEIFSKIDIDPQQIMEKKYPVKHVKSVGAIILNPQGKVLIMFQKRNRYWEFPKGKVEPGEEKEEISTLRREIEEEAGITDLEVDENFVEKFRYQFILHGNLIKKMNVFYLGRVNNSEVKLSEEHTKYLWVSLDEGIKYSRHKNQKVLIRKLKHYLQKNGL